MQTSGAHGVGCPCLCGWMDGCREADEDAMRVRRVEEERRRMQLIEEHEKELLETQSIPLRHYLMQYVVCTFPSIDPTHTNKELWVPWCRRMCGCACVCCVV